MMHKGCKNNYAALYWHIGAKHVNHLNVIFTLRIGVLLFASVHLHYVKGCDNAVHRNIK